MKEVKYLERDELLEKWGKVLDAGEGITDPQIRLNTAKVLESTEADRTPGSLVAEDIQKTADAGFDTGTSIGAGDMRWPSIVIPTVRRLFPNLNAHELFSVQPMSSSLGYAYALRTKYDEAGMFLPNGSTSQNVEMGYQTLDTRFTGTSGVTPDYTNTSADMWQSYAGTSTSAYYDGQGASLARSEGAVVNTNYPMAKLDLVKGPVEAQSRKLAANWSPELSEDLANQHGVDVDATMTELLTYEVQNGIDRQLISTAVREAINGNFTSTWSPVSADGRNQIERIGTIITQVLIKSNEIAKNTQRGSANWVIASSKVAGLLERMNNIPMMQGTTTPSVPNSDAGSLNKVGLINNGKQLLYRDTYAPNGADYILLGYNGKTAGDSGIVYCPYIPMQLMRAIKDADFSPEIGVRTRYGVFTGYNADNWGAGRFYQFIKVDGLVDTALKADGSRIFTYA